ncbi:flavin-containing monooxygenase [Streptomyces caniscabiei]|uniref:NAD(P)/FAD-dependent oxidoreductase n=1 Tax=Streptomyces caniscabiei TaxID=2746961 RepID=A0ABU4N4D5_9ACTN|nr:NAD(P)/FAD-dependent oxidoreductase [Streptomyces caniscabiei]MBE4739689.1 NAD(P)/FAD-dependent oxidoreductase [Streptomyces caniscabiei]MBE4760299.1 NAD(P)/FAD-dependent oxidoreductase [Streptomyces caniscabiei]MBE4773676.1 NAD(P)/FAD-dependent oxidoreductase [Streptomyces caniscabiei]MBE4782631.1 NAD(P)/FAD-dependent oxidoreductase [Streptomyces caniscabiei]MBE4791934.1 NAD(P)/FAD-dependent oxidoreductase [Streptomyces caniscabiei]
MPTPHTPSGPPSLDPEELGFDPDALRARYRAERERRIRPDGGRQYQRIAGEFEHYDDDPYADGESAREPLTDRVEAIVVGGGFGGLLAGARLRQAGVESIRVIEKGSDFGGTWYWNRYPGIHCDIESYIYLPLLEELGYVPKWKYAPGEEIRQHSRAIGRHFDLYRDAAFCTVATELRWDDTELEWIVSTDRGDRMRARYVVVSSGTLSQPKLPGIPGIETFKGHTFHTSRWDYDYTGGDASGGLTGLADKRVAVIGTGATAIQVVPHLGADAAHVYVFQRTPSTVDVRGNGPTDPAWAETLAPGWQAERMDNFLRTVTGIRAGEDLVDDAWTSSARLQEKLIPTDAYADVPADERERAYEIADFQKMNELRDRVATLVEDPETAEKLKPWYRYMCKRPTFSDHYLQTFNRPNVTLVDTADTHGVERITEKAVVVGGVEYEVDCVIFATGFEVGVSGLLSGRLPAYGRDGVGLLETWMTAGPKTLHGFYSHGFPNLFQLGPLQNASAVNYVHILDQQSIHVGEVVAEARRRRARYVEPSAEAQDAWVATVREKAADLYRFQAECTPGYYNNEGRPRERSESYGDGPVAFHELLRRWRADGGIDDVLVGAE